MDHLDVTLLVIVAPQLHVTVTLEELDPVSEEMVSSHLILTRRENLPTVLTNFCSIGLPWSSSGFRSLHLDYFLVCICINRNCLFCLIQSLENTLILVMTVSFF